jgi:hypothetical protein
MSGRSFQFGLTSTRFPPHLPHFTRDRNHGPAYPRDSPHADDGLMPARIVVAERDEVVHALIAHIGQARWRPRRVFHHNAIAYVTPAPITHLKKTAGFFGRFSLDTPFLSSGEQHRWVKHLSLGLLLNGGWFIAFSSMNQLPGG